MSNKLVDKSCQDFAFDLADKVSVPGGGGAAALVGALGIALGSMAGEFTAGKQAYAEVESDVQRMLGDAENIRFRLLELVDEDAEAFAPLAKAYALPADDPARAEELERCTKVALAAPIEMVREICKAIDLLEEMAQKCAKIIVSDAGCGASICGAALEAAAINVFVNTAALQDRMFAERVDKEIDELLAGYLPKAQAITQSVMASIRG